MKARPDPAAPRFADLDLWESPQVQSALVLEGAYGPEAMLWLDGRFASWWPALSIERAEKAARRMVGECARG